MSALDTGGQATVWGWSGARCSCVLLVDTSSAVQGAALAALQIGLETLQKRLCSAPAVMRRVDMGLVTYGGEPAVRNPMGRADRFVAPTLRAGGSANMGAGIELATHLLKDRGPTRREDKVGLYRPWLLLLAAARGSDDLNRAQAIVREGEASRRLAFFAVASHRANVKQLSTITARPSMSLDGLRYEDLFIWFEQSLVEIVRTPIWKDPKLPALEWTLSRSREVGAAIPKPRQHVQDADAIA